MFNSLEGAISDYTSDALDGYDKKDVAGLLTNRLEKARERLEAARETVKAICEPVLMPRKQANYFAYFSAVDMADEETIDFAVKTLSELIQDEFDEDQGIMHVKSASRVGYSDIGVNRRRVKKIRQL